MSEVAQRSKRAWGRLLLLAGIVLAGAFLARAFGLQEILSLKNLAHLKAWIDSFGPLAPLVFITGYILAVIFFVPGLPITVLGGVAFGPLWGTVYVSIASTIGVALAFLVARYGARGLVERWMAESPRLAKIDQAVARHGWQIVMITRLVPLFPFNLQNYAYGLTRISFWSYLLTSWPCMLPGTAAYTFAGGALSEGGGDIQRTLLYLGIAGALLVLVTLIPRWLNKTSPATDDLLR
ncbi:TVP38/TMEM64 family inner membrane protein YdjZ [Candidatus Methylomirabilis lanthanidiphila]|uniref:TVP38/TMEM64 family membrane protein n=1 Tax=Candidatus Methylomirabilis lanthanidiphila TaxID=2211376 RepID=A0A564ZI39_9BACT|nr:TVP38/TMEM64 family protein [Candidatus Methylomirabilis lanthanidiphila]VUZ85010.1 TVP38/TMEM64 family inner membrane protein YdjZ [Candidatus Methylomirabilis lanthanidiphila]